MTQFLSAHSDKPPRQFQPQVIHGLFLRLFCAAFCQVKVYRRADQRMLLAIGEAIAVQKIGLLPLAQPFQSIVQFPARFLFFHNTLRLHGVGVGYYYCFACGANGDAIDLTAKLFDLNPRQAAEKLIHDFGLDPDKPPANAIALTPPKRGLTDEQWADIAYCLRVLTDYLDLLHDWQERYKPATPEEPHDPRFEEALHTTETIEHLTDCVAFGTPQQKADAAAQLLSGSYLLMLEERTDRLALAKCA